MKTIFFILLFTPSLFTIEVQAQSNEKSITESKQLRQENKIDEAMKIINQVLEKDSLNTDAIVVKASLFFRLEKYQDAYNIYTKGLNSQPNNSILLSQRGILLAQLGNYELAENDLESAENGLKINQEIPKDCKSYQVIGTLAGYLNHNKKSYKYLKKAMNCNPNNSEVYINLSATCFDLDKTDEGLEYLIKASQFDPDNYMILGNLGFAYQKKGEFKLAIDYFSKALVLKPNEPQAIGNIAFNQYKLGKLTIALENINKSIDLKPENAYSYRTRALIYLEMGEKENACDDIQTAINKDYTKLFGNEAEEFKDLNCK